MHRRQFMIAAAILIAANVLVITAGRGGTPVVVQMNLDNLPMQIDGLMASEDAFPDSVYKVLNADLHVYRHYRNAGERQIDLYMGYYGTAKGGRTSHDPYGCLSGAGWGITRTSMVTLHPEHYPEAVRVNHILARKGQYYETILWWYQSDGDQVLATGIQQNVFRFLNRLLNNRNDGAFVRVSVFSDQDGTEAAAEQAGAFAVRLLDLLPQYWPVEQ